MKKLFLIFLLMFFSAVASYSATYYMATDGNDSNPGTTDSRWATLSHAFSTMAAGDTLIVGDGTYNQRLVNPPSGTSLANMTTIKAENNGLAIFEITSANSVMLFQAISYVIVEGFKFSENVANATGEVALIDSGSNYNKFLRCAFVKNPTTTQENVSNFDLNGNYNLIEECWAWGGGRYKFAAFGGDNTTHGSYNIFRRCVVRHDREYSGGYNPQAAFCNYQAANTIFQNCIVVDSNFPIDSNATGWAAQPYYDHWAGCWFLEKGQKGAPCTITGCMVINYSHGFINDDNAGDDSDIMYRAGNFIFTNNVAINGDHGILCGFSHTNRDITVDHCAIYNLTGYAYWDADDLGWGFEGGAASNARAVSTNSIYYNLDAANGGGLLRVNGANDYNCFYGNSTDRTSSATGAHDKTTTNPATSWMYPVRIETGSALKAAGSSGSDIGPDITKKIGVAGTLYGETGYNTVTDDNLWPFPNEDRIKSDMSSYPSSWPSGSLPSPTRGFCASEQTLTKYIWETLGNTIPSEIYGDEEPDPVEYSPVTIENISIQGIQFN